MNISIPIQTFGCILRYLLVQVLTYSCGCSLPEGHTWLTLLVWMFLAWGAHLIASIIIEGTKYFSSTPNDGIIQLSFWDPRTSSPAFLKIGPCGLLIWISLPLTSWRLIVQCHSMSPHFQHFHLCGIWVLEAPTTNEITLTPHRSIFRRLNPQRLPRNWSNMTTLWKFP